ncbi:MAG: hypothetical protein IV100_26540 [Myxococcales bacterium]|nr:hypothetical protein [Myxococcales bacterium]
MRYTAAAVVTALVGIGLAAFIGMEADQARGGLIGVYAALAVIGFVLGRGRRAVQQTVAGVFLIAGSLAVAYLALHLADAFA